MPVASAATPSAASKPSVPNWWLHVMFPRKSYLRMKASTVPALTSPGNVPSVRPTTYKPEASIVTPRAVSKLGDPNSRVQRRLPEISYPRTYASTPAGSGSAREAPARMARDEDPRPAGRDGVAIVETCGSKLAVPQEATVEVVFPKQRIIVVCGHRPQGPPHHVDTGRIDSDGAAVIPSGGPELTDPQNLGAGLTTRAWCG